AVLAVLVYHLDLGWLPGGFLGVDIFFVLSGFLITTLLIREFDVTGRIALADFYVRRFRRLLPAVVVLVVVVALVSRRYDPIAQLSWREDAVATLMYVANWHFISSDASYFAEFADVSPLRHMWSLAIEEQFYVVWPLLAWASLRLRRWFPEIIVSLLLIGSAVTMAVTFAADPSRSYYGTDTRVHELLIGVAAALLLRRLGEPRDAAARTRRAWHGTWLLSVGAAGVAVGLATLRGESADYYYGGAVALSACTAMMILGVEFGRGTPRRKWDALTWLLSNPVAVWVGAISYSLYLWHWPVQVLLESGDVGLEGNQLAAARAVASLLLATASYYLVEQPLRRPRADATPTERRQSLAAVPGILLLTGVVVFAATPAAANSEPWNTQVPAGTITVLGSTKHGAPTLAVVGDSIAKSLMPALDQVAHERGVRLIAAAWSGCGIGIGYQIDMDGKSDLEFSKDCYEAVPSSYARLVARYRPEVVWAHSVRERFPMRADDGRILMPRTAEHDAALLAGYRRSYDVLSAEGAVVEFAPVTWPSLRHKGICRDVKAQLPQCQADDGTDGVYQHINDVIAQFAASTGGVVKQVGTAPVICPAGPPCPESLPNNPDVYLRWDGSHFTPPGAALVAPALFDAIDAAAGYRLTNAQPGVKK
ncbi:MAG: hypothetical protein RL745_852, partial [Actinomycetota bacterium]